MLKFSETLYKRCVLIFIVHIESETSQALDLISIQISKILSSSNFDTFTDMTLKLQEAANFGMFVHVMQTIHFIHVCVR